MSDDIMAQYGPPRPLAASIELFVEEFGEGKGSYLYSRYAEKHGPFGVGWAHCHENIRQNVIHWVWIFFGDIAESRIRTASAGNEKKPPGTWCNFDGTERTAILHTGSLFYLTKLVDVVHEKIDRDGPSRSSLFRSIQVQDVSPIDALAATVSGGKMKEKT